MVRCNVHSGPPLSEYHSEVALGEGDSIAAPPLLQQVYGQSSEWLRAQGVEDHADSARYLLCHATQIGYRYSDFHSQLKRAVTAAEIAQMRNFLQQRAERRPVQYIIGNWDFYGMTFSCKPPVLIPRPETEELVERIITSRICASVSQPQLLDIGAGTGALGIALLSQLPAGSSCLALDIQPVAVQLANDNAKELLSLDSVSPAERKYECINLDIRHLLQLLRAGDSYADKFRGKFDLIVSNPPYIPSRELPRLQREVRDYEDSVALDGGADGLDLIKDIIAAAPMLLSPLGTRELWLEVSEEHPAMLAEWMRSRSSLDLQQQIQFVEGITDLSGNPRFVRFRCPTDGP